MNRIERKFKDLKAAKRKAFIAFITAGYPDLRTTKKLILEFDRIGVDIIELGVPFSDPLADGPMIQESSQEALKKKVHLIDILDLVRKVRKNTNIPICLMTYYNPVFCFGEERFINSAVESGVDGVIIPDLPPDEGRRFFASSRKIGLDTIGFLSPTSSVERGRFIAKVASGFIYYVCLTGVTGVRKKLPADIISNVKKIKLYTNKPICVGFGVSSPKQVRQICRFADGVIVGSAIVSRIKDCKGSSDLVHKVSAFVKKLSDER